jgi:cell volume regulation protein A
MQTAEPASTALFFTGLAVLLALSALLTRAAERVRVPVPLLFLLIGMAAGSEGIGRIDFEDYRFAFRIGSAALMLILFDGGLNTSMSVIKQVFRQAALLATVGVVGTAGLVALFAHALGAPWTFALLLGAVVSSTDAAAVFSVLRSSGIHLKRRVGGTLEVESGINDPVAVILTTLLTSNLLTTAPTPWWRIALDVVMQIVVGGGIGVAIGYGGRFVLSRYRLPTSGIYPVLTIAFALLAFGAPTLLDGSGFLGVYVAAVILGNGPLPYRGSLLRVHDALGWLAQVTMFLVLGLLVFPSRLIEVAWIGLALALFLAIVARPAVVGLCLAPFRYAPRDIVYVGWVGLRGAVPIVLATYPVLEGAPGAERLFTIVFFIVVVNALVPGATVPWVTRRLGLESADPPAPHAVLGIESLQPLNGELLSYYIDEALAVCGATLGELPFPSGASVTIIVRGRELVPPKGDTRLETGDHVYIFARPEDLSLIQLMFGRPEAE